jgi:hypothetical protein
MHKHLRIVILVLILLIVAMGNWVTKMRSTNWSHTLRVVVYPINGDGSIRSANYISKLEDESFNDIEDFFIEELKLYGLAAEEPVNVSLSAEVHEKPPAAPVNGSILEIMFWSLKLRYWAFQRDEYKGPKPEVQLFVVYFDPQTSPQLQHSLGLQKGLVGVVNVFADRKKAGTNHFIITHELLHTLGATDKYDMQTNEPLYPQGYAEPDLQPVYPQSFAEVMGGRIPVSEYASKIPLSLFEVTVGEQTAREIRWIK